MFKCLKLNVFAVLLVVLGCQEQVSRHSDARVLAIGDSLMAWNSISGRSVPHVIENVRGQDVIDRSLIGAVMSPPDLQTIPMQYIAGDWDWVLVNGGGNDLAFKCGCRRCERILDKMVSIDGQTGIIPDLLRKARDGGAQVLYFGYLRSPELTTVIEGCKEEGEALDARVARLAKSEPGIHFLSMDDIVPKGGRGYFDIDTVHPSPKASRAVGRKIALYMNEIDAELGR